MVAIEDREMRDRDNFRLRVLTDCLTSGEAEDMVNK